MHEEDVVLDISAFHESRWFSFTRVGMTLYVALQHEIGLKSFIDMRPSIFGISVMVE